MILNKSERYTAYCIMLQEAESNSNIVCGFCNMIKIVFSLPVYKHAAFKETFPELFSFKPHWATEQDRWFRGDYDWKQRIEVLKECIKQTEREKT